MEHRPQPVNFIVLDEQSAEWVDPDSVRIAELKDADNPERCQISDHCPVVLDLRS